MVNQMFTETLYDAKQHKGRVIIEVALVIGAILCALFGIPHLCIMLLAFIVNVKIWNVEKETLPECVSFFPVSNEELTKYMLWKSYALSVGLAGLLFLSYVYIVLCSNQYVNENEFWELGIYQVISFFFYVHIMSFSIEQAKRSRTKAAVNVQLKNAFKGEVTYVMFIVLFAIIFIWCCMGVIRDVDSNEPEMITWLERIILWILLASQFVTYRVIKKMLMEAFIYNDYNAKITKDEEVDYEY